MSIVLHILCTRKCHKITLKPVSHFDLIHYKIWLNFYMPVYSTYCHKPSEIIFNPTILCWVKVKVIPQKTEVVQGVPGRLRPRIFLTFGTRRVVGRQPNAPAAFTPGEIPGTHFQRLSRPQSTWFCRWEPRKKFPVTPPGIDPGTVWLVAQCLNHYATPGPLWCWVHS